jgi:hypothetical protein
MLCFFGCSKISLWESSCFLLHNDLMIFHAFGTATRFPNEMSCFSALMTCHEISSLAFHAFFWPPTRFPYEMFMIFLLHIFLIEIDFLMRFHIVEGSWKIVFMRCHAFWAPTRFPRSICCCLLHNCLVRFPYEISNAFCSTVFLWDFPFEIFCFLWHQFSCEISSWDFMFCSYIIGLWDVMLYWLLQDFRMRLHALWAIRDFMRFPPDELS